MADSKRVLVADDDAAITMMIQATLEDEGFDVAAAVGQEVIDLATQAPNRILLDLRCR